MLMHTYDIYKSGTDEPISRVGIEIQMYRIDLWAQGGRGEGGMNGESGIGMYTLS